MATKNSQELQIDLRVSLSVVLLPFLLSAFAVIIQKVDGVDLAFAELFDLKITKLSSRRVSS